MSIGSIGGALAANHFWSGTSAAVGQSSFLQQLNTTVKSDAETRLEEYTEYLKKRFGANVIVKDVGNDQKSIDQMGATTSGYNNVVIAPNILERMAGDLEMAAYYEGKIKQGLDRFPIVQAQLSAAGHEVYSYGVHIDSHGTVYTYVCGDLKPEVRAKIEAQIRAEQAAKKARREMFSHLHQEAAEERRELLEAQNQKREMERILRDRVFDTDANLHIVNPSQVVDFTVMAYQSGMGGTAGIPAEAVLTITQAQI